MFFSDWYRYEIELKFDVTRDKFFKAVSQGQDRRRF